MKFELPRMKQRAGSQSSVLLFRSLASMLPAGVPVSKALSVIARDNPDPVMARTVRTLVARLDHGAPLSLAMAEHADVFNGFQVGLVKVGESTGKLDEILGWLASYEEKARNLQLRYRAALTYPLFVSTLAVVLMIVSPPVVFRMLLPFLAEHPENIPLITRFYLVLCHLLVHPLFWLVAAVLATVVVQLGRRAWARPESRYQLSCRLLKAGPLGRFLHTYGLARFSRALSIQLGAGVSPLQALPLAAQVSGDPVLIERMPMATRAMVDGRSLGVALKLTDYFPRSFLSYLAAAEECASFARDFERLADLYDADLECCARAFAGVLEPLVMMALGFSAALMIFAVTLPMLQLVQQFS